ncbi:MAG: PorP/SprF family type IX secretion system membrane protein [Owenweeksia sp.]
MRKIYALSFLLALPFIGSAQQNVQFTQFMFNRVYYNPAVAGTGGAICINALHRSQWVGFEGAPTTQNINGNIPVRAVHGGFAVNIINDQIGFFQNIEAGLGYAYQLELARGTLGFGVGVRFINNSVNNAEWRPSDQSISDFGIPGQNASGIAIDPAFGIYYSSENIWGGVSSINLIETTSALAGTQGAVGYRNARHYYIMGGYNWQIPASNWMIMPSTLVKTDARSSPTFDINVMAMHNNKFWGGVTYRLQDAVGVNIGYQILPSLKAGYSYDVATGDLSSQGGGSHEIMLKYCFRIEIPPREKGSYRNPRFL